MLRPEFIVVGCILAVVGVALCIVGYNKTQPTAVDSVVSFLETVSGEKAPTELRRPKNEGYALLAGGALVFLVGVGFVLNSRTSATGGVKGVDP
jgi:hypothetical protein